MYLYGTAFRRMRSFDWLRMVHVPFCGTSMISLANGYIGGTGGMCRQFDLTSCLRMFFRQDIPGDLTIIAVHMRYI